MLRIRQVTAAARGDLDAPRQMIAGKIRNCRVLLRRNAVHQISGLVDFLLKGLQRVWIDRLPQARARIQDAQAKIADAITRRRSEQARTWMEKHIHDFKRGHELESIQPKGKP